MSNLPDAVVETRTYDHALYGIRGRWRGVVAIILLIVGYLLASTILGLIAIVIDLSLGNATLEELEQGIVHMTPALMLLNNLSIAAMIPIALLLQRWLFGVRAATLFSVEARIRWRWMGRIALIIVPVWVIYSAVELAFAGPQEISVDGTMIALLVIVILTTPFQAAAEEIGARGLIQRSVGSWIRNPRRAWIAGTALSAALFALAHLAADPWLITFYLLFAVSMSYSARVTGGLEAPIVLHVINNVLAFVPTVLFDQMDEAFNREAGVGSPIMLIPMALVVLVAVFSGWCAKRYGVKRLAAPPVTVKQERAALLPPPAFPPEPLQAEQTPQERPHAGETSPTP